MNRLRIVYNGLNGIKIVRIGFMGIRTGDIVQDNHGRIGIVISEAEQPDHSWIALQTDQRVRKVSDSRWWEILILNGGAALIPEELATPIRRGTIKDAHKLVSEAHVYRKKILADALIPLFPELLQMPGMP